MQQLLDPARHSSLGKGCPPKTLLAWHEPRLQVWLIVKYSGVTVCKKGSVKLGAIMLALARIKDERLGHMYSKPRIPIQACRLSAVLFVRTE